ncbi:RimK family alpha-L-glutamate ligase [Amycolatopsis sp. DSM 110486]|uniref:ATP-grasp domain-containing protein n=1 Tax=Amycolatopsis sp. DSM 110486 TaxID=2865832 RepID=UPI001C69F924|nr:ATP-grasp domain-containing protein [Amycolatopsis sp. DSM 110486]QYN17606.1 ATP-grasp domain-containing protein [Amycolatopsis sp. DSM 110486]
MTARDPKAKLIADEMERRGYPVDWLSWGSFTTDVKGRKVMFRGVTSELTTQVAASIAFRKGETNRLLAAAGLSIPEFKTFTATMGEQAMKYAAETIGWPVVVKPDLSPGAGAGVMVNVGEGEFTEAFRVALSMSHRALVQAMVSGQEARFLVIGDKCVSVLRKTIDPVTGKPIDESHEGITSQVHPFYKREAERAVAAFPGLGVAGLDIIAPDFTTKGDYWILEANSTPDIIAHHDAKDGERFDMAGAIADALEKEIR